MAWVLIGELFNRYGDLDLDGDEEEINEGSKIYKTFEDAFYACEKLANQYPNAYVDVLEVEE